MEPVDFLTFLPSGCSLVLAQFAPNRLLSSSPLPPFSCSLSHDAAGDQIFDLNFALEAEGDEEEAFAAAAATTSEFMREVKGAVEWRAALGDEGWMMGNVGTGEESSARTHRSSGESGEFPSDDGDDEDMASTAWNLSITQMMTIIIMF